MDLITGATGHIGNVLVRQLIERGRGVRALVRGREIPPALDGLDVEILQGDILEPASLERAMEGVEVVYHLAAQISLLTGPDPQTERVNIEGTRNVLQAIRKAGARRLVYASSIYAMRKPEIGRPIDEDQPFEVNESAGSYDASKAKASLEVQKAAKEWLDAVILCPTAVTGPYDFHDSETGRAIQLYMRPGIKFLVDGAYDFVDVRDVANGFLQAAERGQRGETYILGGERMTLEEVARTIWAATGSPRLSFHVPLGLAYAAAGLMPLLTAISGTKPLFTKYSLDIVCSNSKVSHAKASRELGFSPRPAREAVVDGVRWAQAKWRGEGLSEEWEEAAG